jgi:hypothetical protein
MAWLARAGARGATREREKGLRTTNRRKNHRLVMKVQVADAKPSLATGVKFFSLNEIQSNGR